MVLFLGLVAPAVLAACGGPAAHPVASSVPPTGPLIGDLTWVSDSHAWGLTAAPDCANWCTASVVTTDDGESPWAQLAAFPQALVSGIAFANDEVGYAFGPDLFMTTDGGVTWVQEPAPPVAALAIVGVSVVRVSYAHSGCPGPCAIGVESSAVGSTRWQPLLSLPETAAGAVQLVRGGPSTIYLMKYLNPAGGAGNEQGTLYVSHDAGVTWAEQADPCGFRGRAEIDTRAIAAAPGGVVAVLCAPRFGGADFIKVSQDGGATFTTSSPLPAAIGFVTLALTGADDIFAGTGSDVGRSSSVLYASHDAGRTWVQAAGEAGATPMYGGGVTFLGFESSRVGRWISANGDIWTTTDGGYTWAAQMPSSS
jgi:photosystem II stability/assembly factor-like uncharacterized protein